MQTVAETASYLAAAEDAGLRVEERLSIVLQLAADPEHGAVMIGTGGCRKWRFAGRGKGKSGGYRIVHVYVGDHRPIYLLTVFSKGEKANLTKAERNALAALVARLK
jgi:hypothetical protein